MHLTTWQHISASASHTPFPIHHWFLVQRQLAYFFVRNFRPCAGRALHGIHIFVHCVTGLQGFVVTIWIWKREFLDVRWCKHSARWMLEWLEGLYHTLQQAVLEKEQTCYPTKHCKKPWPLEAMQEFVQHLVLDIVNQFHCLRVQRHWEFAFWCPWPMTKESLEASVPLRLCFNMFRCHLAAMFCNHHIGLPRLAQIF